MTSYLSPTSASCTASVPIKLESGSKDSGSGPNLDSPQHKRSMSVTSPNDLADIQKPFTTSGTQEGRLPSSTACATHGPFSIRSNGSIGLELIDGDGRIIAWTTDPWVAQVICRLLNEEGNR